MKVALVLPPLATAELPLTMSYSDWKSAFGESFNGDDDDARRQAIYDTTITFIEAENSKNHSYTLGVNQFSHLTEDEFVSRFTGGHAGSLDASKDVYMGMLEAGARADAIDWTTKGVVNPIKDQGSCGSCWAFSAVGTLESGYAVTAGNLHTLSEQQLLDCEDYTQAGCDGGYNDKAMTYFSKFGACSEESYPYTATDFNDNKCQAGETEHGKPGEAKCSFDIEPGVVSGYNDIKKDAESLESALNDMPVSVTIRADSTIQSYRSGVLDGPKCGIFGQINHAVIAVGYDAESFKIRNSWGESWGENGYFRVTKSIGGNGPICLFKQNPVVPTFSLAVAV